MSNNSSGMNAKGRHRTHAPKSGSLAPRRSVRALTGDSLDVVSASASVRSQTNSVVSIASKPMVKTSNANKKKKRHHKKRSEDRTKRPHAKRQSARKSARIATSVHHVREGSHRMRLKKSVRTETTTHTTTKRRTPRTERIPNNASFQSDNPLFGNELRVVETSDETPDEDEDGDVDVDVDVEIDDARSLSSVSTSNSFLEALDASPDYKAPLLVNSNTMPFGGSWIGGLKGTTWLDSISGDSNTSPGRNARITDASNIHMSEIPKHGFKENTKAYAARIVGHLSSTVSRKRQSTPGLTIPIKSVRRLVSRNRSRYVDQEYDLDLSYVTPRIIAMGYPSTGLDKYYRNAASTVFRFFETNHQHHYRIYNLCINRRYPDKSDLRPHVARYGFFDHNPCPMQTLRSLCLDVDLWLTEHPANIAAIHCKAGKGRTGLVVAAYLMHSGAVHNAEDAIRFFGNKRTKDGRGVTIPSQYRYVRYYELALNDEKLMHRIEGPVSAGVVFHLVAITFHSVDVTWPAPHAQAIKLRVLAPDGVLMAKTKAYEYYPRSPTMPAEGPPKFAHGFELDTLGLSSTGEVLDTQADTVVDAAPVTTQRKGHVRQQPSQGSSSVKARIFGGSATLPGSALEALNVPAPPPCGFAMVRPITPVRVQGDTRLHVQFATKRLTGSGNSSTTMFQCWFNTNFLPVSNKSSGGGESDFVFAGAMSPTELGDSRARSCMPLMKIELDGKIRKDKAHKITPANFVMAMHFVAAKSQPNVELSPSGRRLDF